MLSSLLEDDDVECTESSVLLRSESRLPRMFNFRLKPTLLLVLTSTGAATAAAVNVVVLPVIDPPAALPALLPVPVPPASSSKLSSPDEADEDWLDRVGSWVLSRFWTVRSSRNASWASFSGSTSAPEIGRVAGWLLVRLGERRHVKSLKVL